MTKETKDTKAGITYKCSECNSMFMPLVNGKLCAFHDVEAYQVSDEENIAFSERIKKAIEEFKSD